MFVLSTLASLEEVVRVGGLVMVIVMAPTMAVLYTQTIGSADLPWAVAPVLLEELKQSHVLSLACGGAFVAFVAFAAVCAAVCACVFAGFHPDLAACTVLAAFSLGACGGHVAVQQFRSPFLRSPRTTLLGEPLLQPFVRT